jgi:hypothetical protein
MEVPAERVRLGAIGSAVDRFHIYMVSEPVSRT